MYVTDLRRPGGLNLLLLLVLLTLLPLLLLLLLLLLLAAAAVAASAGAGAGACCWLPAAAGAAVAAAHAAAGAAGGCLLPPCQCLGCVPSLARAAVLAPCHTSGSGLWMAWHSGFDKKLLASSPVVNLDFATERSFAGVGVPPQRSKSARERFRRHT